MTVKHPAFSHWWRHSEGGSDTSPCLYVEICQDMTCLDFGVWQVMSFLLKTWSNLTCGDGEGVIFIEPFKQIYMMKY